VPASLNVRMPLTRSAYLAKRTSYHSLLRLRVCSETGSVVLEVSPERFAGTIGCAEILKHLTSVCDPNNPV